MTSARSAIPGMLPLRDNDPREVGGYELVGRLGEGGQGVVYLAVSKAGTRVALKVLPTTSDPQVRNRFLKEVAAAQRVARFCTAQVLDAWMFEREPMDSLTAQGQVHAFRHRGFWQAMDTLRDKQRLEELWAGGRAPWKVW